MRSETRPASTRGSIHLGGRRVPFVVRRNTRARRIWLKIEDHVGLVVVLPRWGRVSLLPEIIRKHKAWILDRLEKRERELADAPPPLGEGRTVIYRGRALPLRVRSQACAQPTVEWQRDQVVVNFPRSTEPDIAGILATSYRERASEVIHRRTEAFAELMGTRPKRIQVRDQKTRWGSCSGRGTLTFNWRLLLAPPQILDYVVVHELCHLRHPNHGVWFWRLVERYCPHYEAYRGWLRENGAYLRAA